ncbi:DNA cytosine methyltransferase [Alkalibacillus salilacus]|uniref:DNA (cytosine-5-)-methyltransferase n=1 Tax=Alkalibacillus salilacus TaxID=284582 RepID=A0ABT9VDK5_9BACI|nr:DNA cytosine methyltransferase [Alkalibacillus salilacus]MDQ0158989.1 DNA (cytosine-5)-methyltransferase 1 [Alkalibacillus salilacus]
MEKQVDLFREIIVDNFAGGGGASTGIELATGLSVDVAINHDPAAIAMHKANHPDTEHYCESVWEVDPLEVAQGRKVGLCWLSPDCKHFSKAKGGKPVNKTVRGLAWIAVEWAIKVRPRVIILENVEEFKTWGPLKDNKPDPDKKGLTFKSYVKSLKALGYKVETKELQACDYGAPTTRKRLFLIARCDGSPIEWPEPTHGAPSDINVQMGLKEPYRTASEIIDWSLPAPSIYDRQKPLSHNTMLRIKRGIKKFVLESDRPYIFQEKAHFLQHYYTHQGTETRASDMRQPVPTIPTANRFGLVSAFLTKYYGQGIGQSINEPLHTISTKDRFGLITVRGESYQITDIGMRMLQPHELFKAQGFPKEYQIDRDYKGKKYPKSQQVARVGNSVPPQFAEKLVRANLPEMCVKPYEYKQAK